jgi:hypothetical protein
MGDLNAAFGISFNANSSTSSQSSTTTPATLTQYFRLVESRVLGGSGVAGTSTRDPQHPLRTLSNEYTTPMLIEDAVARALAAPLGDWAPTTGTVFASSALPKYDDTGCDARREEWKAILSDTKADQVYELRWRERFVSTMGVPGPWVGRSVRLLGTGGVLTHVEPVPLPSGAGKTEHEILEAVPVPSTANGSGGPGGGGPRARTSAGRGPRARRRRRGPGGRPRGGGQGGPAGRPGGWGQGAPGRPGLVARGRHAGQARQRLARNGAG